MTDTLTKKQQLFLELLFEDSVSSPKEAAKLAGYNSDNIANILQSKALCKAVLERTEKFTAMHAPHAVMTLIDVTKNPAKKGAMTSITAAKELLDRGGLVRKDKLEVETTQTMNVIQLPELNEE